MSNTNKTLGNILKIKKKGGTWQDVADEMKLGSEASARRLYNKLSREKDKNHKYSEFTRDALKKSLVAKKHKQKRYIISTITPMAGTNKKAYATLRNMAKELKAELVLLLGRQHQRPLAKQIHFYDPWLMDQINSETEIEISLVTEYQFNHSVMAVDLQINPQQINQLSGVSDIHFGEQSSSVVVASTQLTFESHPRGNGRTPRVVMGTGTISMPNYLQDTRVGKIAEQNHQFGAIIIETIDAVKFSFRDLEIMKDGCVHDIANGVCKKYTPTGSVKAQAEAVVMGDVHVGHDDMVFRKAQERLFKILKPKTVVMHDVIDGNSASHHTWDTPYDRVTAPFFSIHEELSAVRDYIDWLQKASNAKNYLWVNSNHHDHIVNHIKKGRYVHDKINYEIGHRMVVDMLDGVDPIKKRIDPKGLLTCFTDKTDHYICGVHVSNHGHLGPNGSRGNIKNLAKVIKNGILGHSHTPGRYRGLLQVGHGSSDDHGYNRGPSGWIQADGVIYLGGQKQLITYFDGRFML